MLGKGPPKLKAWSSASLWCHWEAEEAWRWGSSWEEVRSLGCARKGISRPRPFLSLSALQLPWGEKFLHPCTSAVMYYLATGPKAMVTNWPQVETSKTMIQNKPFHFFNPLSQALCYNDGNLTHGEWLYCIQGISTSKPPKESWESDKSKWSTAKLKAGLNLGDVTLVPVIYKLHVYWTDHITSSDFHLLMYKNGVNYLRVSHKSIWYSTWGTCHLVAPGGSFLLNM